MLGVFGLLLLHIIYSRCSRWRAELFFVYTRFNIRMAPVGSIRGEKIGGAPLVFRSYASRFSVMRSWDILVLREKRGKTQWFCLLVCLCNTKIMLFVAKCKWFAKKSNYRTKNVCLRYGQGFLLGLACCHRSTLLHLRRISV